MTAREIRFLFPRSSGTVREWTHKGMLKAMPPTEEFLDKPNRKGGVVLFDTRRAGVLKLLQCWTDCALDKNCIAPEGSSRKNHRQDQAALTILVYQSEFANVEAKLPEIRTHQDL